MGYVMTEWLGEDNEQEEEGYDSAEWCKQTEWKTEWNKGQKWLVKPEWWSTNDAAEWWPSTKKQRTTW